MNAPNQTSSGNTGINTSLGVSMVAAAIAIIVVLAGIGSLVVAAFGPGTGDVQPAQELERLMAKHNEELQTWKDRFNGRSAFFKPPPPPPPRRDPPPQREIPKVVEEKPPEPTIDPTYRGPTLAFAYGDVAYFNAMSVNDNPKYLRVRVGEEKSGLKLIGTSLPWSVKVGYKGGEYDVPIFTRIEDSPFIVTSPKPVILTNFLMPAPGEQPPTTEAASTPEAPAIAANPAALPGNISQQEPPRRNRRDRTPAAAPTEVGTQDAPPDEPVVEDTEEVAPDEEGEVVDEEAEAIEEAEGGSEGDPSSAQTAENVDNGVTPERAPR